MIGAMRRVGAALAPLLAALALAAAATTAPDLVRGIVDPPADEERWSRPELDPRHIGIPVEVVERTEELVPRDASYTIVFGDQIPVESGGIGVRQGLVYFLLPRRWTNDHERAEWVLAWGESSEALGVRVRREVGLVPGVNLVEVER